METVMPNCASAAIVLEQRRQYDNHDKDDEGSIPVAPVLLLVADITGAWWLEVDDNMLTFRDELKS